MEISLVGSGISGWMGKSWWNDGGLSIHFTYFTYGRNVISYEFIYFDALELGKALLSFASCFGKSFDQTPSNDTLPTSHL
jgi:hypothetical protein